jgi:hypothetical protein
MRSKRNRRTPHRAKVRDNKAEIAKAYWKIGLACTVLLAVVVIVVTLKPTPVNALTGCPKSQTAPEAHTVILIDATDRLPRNELRFLQDLVMTEYMWLPEGGRLTVRTLLAAASDGEDIVVCRVAESSRTGGLLDNERRIRKRFDKIAGGPLADLFTDLADAPEQEASPIMEAVAMVLERSDFLQNVPDRRLIVVSDFAQHSDSHSMYGGRGSMDPSREVAEELLRDMSGVDVRLQYVRRTNLRALQSRSHREFWETYVEEQEPNSIALGHGLLIGENPRRLTYQYASPGMNAPGSP